MDMKKINDNIPLIIGCSAGLLSLYYFYTEIESLKCEVNSLKKELLNLKSFIKYQLKDEMSSENVIKNTPEASSAAPYPKSLTAGYDSTAEKYYSDGAESGIDEDLHGIYSDEESIETDKGAGGSDSEEENSEGTGGSDSEEENVGSSTPTGTPPKLFELEQSDLEEVVQKPKCKTIIKSGSRKGQECSRPNKKGSSFCTIHSD